jgi:hypothetical protein
MNTDTDTTPGGVAIALAGLLLGIVTPLLLLLPLLGQVWIFSTVYNWYRPDGFPAMQTSTAFGLWLLTALFVPYIHRDYEDKKVVTGVLKHELLVPVFVLIAAFIGRAIFGV